MLHRLRLSETESSLTEYQSDRVESALSAPGLRVLMHSGKKICFNNYQPPKNSYNNDDNSNSNDNNFNINLYNTEYRLSIRAV